MDGFNIHDNGKGVIQNCKVYENTLDGVYIGKGSTPVIQQCPINHNGGWGVELQEMSTAIVEECNLTDNAKGAWQIASDCQVNQKGNIEVT
jgi:parallel beta-helix repeat protein